MWTLNNAQITVTLKRHAPIFVTVSHMSKYVMQHHCQTPPGLSPVVLSLQEVELLLDPVAGLGDGEL